MKRKASKARERFLPMTVGELMKRLAVHDERLRLFITVETEEFQFESRLDDIAVVMRSTGGKPAKPVHIQLLGPDVGKPR